MKMAGSFSMLLSLLLVFHLTNSIFSQGTRGAVDLTLKAGEIGEDVVDASILKINLIGDLFENDYDFMKRIAFVESRFGTNRTVMSMFPDRGIWQVASRMQRYILSHEKTTGLLNRISQFFGDEITNMTSDNFSIPIRSAIASRLFIDLQLGNSSFPATLSDQARWWSTNYHPGGRADRFLSAVREHETNHSCSRPPFDVWFLVDNSGSLGVQDLNQTLIFVDQLSWEFTISPDRDKTGLMLFATNTILVSDFSQHQSNVEFSNAVRGTSRQPARGTRVGKALKNTLLQGFNVQHGARALSEGIPRILIVITDGKSRDDVEMPSEKLKANGVTIFSIGIGDKVDRQQLNEIASDPNSEYAFRVRDFSNLLNILRRRMLTVTCNLPRTLSNDSNVVFQLDPRNPSYAALKIERDASSGNDDDITNLVHLRIRLIPINLNASGQVYLSNTYPQPNAALHDLSISLSSGEIKEVNTTIDESTSSVNLAFIANDNPFELRVTTTINHSAVVKINEVSTSTTKLVNTATEAMTTTKATTTTATATPVLVTTTEIATTTAPISLTTSEIAMTTTPISGTTTKTTATTTPISVTSTEAAMTTTIPVSVTTTETTMTTTPISVTTTETTMTTTPISVTTTEIATTTAPISRTTSEIAMTTTPISGTTTETTATTTPISVTSTEAATTTTTTTPAVTEPSTKTPEVVATPDSGKNVTTSSRASITADPPTVSGSETTADDITVASTSSITVSETETTSGTSRKSLAIGSLWLSSGILVKLFCEQLGL